MYVIIVVNTKTNTNNLKLHDDNGVALNVKWKDAAKILCYPYPIFYTRFPLPENIATVLVQSIDPDTTMSVWVYGNDGSANYGYVTGIGLKHASDMTIDEIETEKSRKYQLLSYQTDINGDS